MSIKKLNIVNGIIQDKDIDGIPVRLQIIQPIGKNNVRTLIPMVECFGITNHNTANTSPSAGDEMHAKYFQNVENSDLQYISAHIFVDQDSITQIIPINEIAYHAGDGKGNGNYKTIGVEICENGNNNLAEENAKKLNAALIKTYINWKVFKHQDWSGKYCPRVILAKDGWNNFVNDIYKLAREEEPLNKEQQFYIAMDYITKHKLFDSPLYWLENAKLGKSIPGELVQAAIIKLVQYSIDKEK